MNLTKLRNLLTLENAVVFALVSHSMYVLYYFMTLATYGSETGTPFGKVSTALIPAILANMTVLLIAKRLGWLQGIGVILTSYAFAYSLRTSGPVSEVLWTTVADIVQLSVACLLFHYFKHRPRQVFVFAAWICGIIAALVYILGQRYFGDFNIIHRILPDIFTITVFLLPVYVLVRVWDGMNKGVTE